AEGRDQDHHAAVPAHPLAERADGGIGVAAAADPPGAPALRARRRFRLRGAHLAGTAWGVRRRRARKRQPSAPDLAQGRHPGPPARPHPAAEFEPADVDREERVGGYSPIGNLRRRTRSRSTTMMLRVMSASFWVARISPN